MKKMIKLLTLSAAVALLSVPVVSAQECTDEVKSGYYTTFREVRTTDQAKAYDVAKKYLACPAPAEVSEQQQAIINYLKKFVTAYEEATRKNKLPELIYTEKKYPEAYALARELLAKEPDNVKIYVDLGVTGYLVPKLNNPALNTEALGYAKKAIELLEAGKPVQDWRPLANKEEALAYLNFTVGTLTLENDAEGALKALMKSVQFETPLKKSAQSYAYIAGAYETGPYARLSKEYKDKYTGKDETDESKLALANINQIIDRMIDAYARAVALAGSDANYAAVKPAWNESLTTWYKYRHQSDAGLTQFVAEVLSKPLPPEPTPLTSLPAATPAATPAANTGGTASTGTATGTPKP